MNAQRLVSSLLEDNPDDIDPKMEMLRNDPVEQMEGLVAALRGEDAKTISYVREKSVASFCLQFHNRVRDFDRVRDWFFNFLRANGVNTNREQMKVLSLGEFYHGEAVRIDFPMAGPDVPYRNYRLGI